MNQPKRILYLSPCWPNEKAFGTQVRVQQTLRALGHVGEVKMVVVRFDDDQQSQKEKYGTGCLVEDFVELTVAPPRSLVSRLRCGLDPYYIRNHGQVIAPQARERVLAAASHFDLIWLHHLHVANAFDRWRWERSVLDIDDLPSTRLLTELRSKTTLRDRWRIQARVLIARARERLLADRFTVLSVCSEADRDYLQAKGPIHVIPNGFPIPQKETPRKTGAVPRIGFIGSLGYPPTLDGLLWFTEECWPQIKAQVPNAQLRLVGKGTDEPSSPAGKDIEHLGWLSDATEEIASWSTMIVPLRIGAGTRVKIAEGFARQCPIVSTSLGAYGYQVKDGQELLLGDTPAGFASACVRLLRDQALGNAIAASGWHYFLEHCSWDAVAPRIQAAAEDCLRRSSSQPHPCEK